MTGSYDNFIMISKFLNLIIFRHLNPYSQIFQFALCTNSFERSLNYNKSFSFKKKINYYVYIQSLSNIQSVFKYTPLFNLIGKKKYLVFKKKYFSSYNELSKL